MYMATGEDCVHMATGEDYLAGVISQMHKVREYQALAVFTQWALMLLRVHGGPFFNTSDAVLGTCTYNMYLAACRFSRVDQNNVG